MTNNSLMIAGDGSIRAVDPRAFPDLDNAKVGIAVDPKYKEFKEGESLRCIFCGFTPIKNGELIAAVMQAKDGFYLNSGVSLVEQLKNLPPGTAVQVVSKGEKNLGGGKRVNLFQVNILDLGEPVTTQSVTVPSPAGAPPAATRPTPAPKPKQTLYNRPLDPETLRDLLKKKVEYHAKKQTLATQADRGILATVLNTTFEGDKEKRRVLTGWLIENAHISAMSQPQVMALLDWLECHAFDSVPPKHAIEEAKAAYEVAVKFNQ